jgi:hypothetical protein
MMLTVAWMEAAGDVELIELVLPQPEQMPAPTAKPASTSNCDRRRRPRPKQQTDAAIADPGKKGLGLPLLEEVSGALAMVMVEVAGPLVVATVAGEKLQDTPAGRPEQESDAVSA